MSKFLISTQPATGHVTPFLSTVAELVARGYDVVWQSGTAVAERIGETGARFVAMRHTPDALKLMTQHQHLRGLSAARAFITALFIEPMAGLLRDYEEISTDFSADAVLVDMCSLGAMLWHRKGGPVWATVGINPLRTKESPLYGSGQMPAASSFARWQNGILNWLSDHVMLAPVNRIFRQQCLQLGFELPEAGKTMFDYLMSPFLHLQGTTPTFEFPYSDLPPQVRFVGPMLPPQPRMFTPPAWWHELNTDRAVVHVTQGTVATDVTQLVIPTIESLAEDDNVLLVVTTSNPEQLVRLPANVRVERMIPHALLLPHVQVMVSNGGYNGVKTALAFGVPLVTAGTSEDKPEVGARVEWARVGINLKTDRPDATVLGKSIYAVLADPSYRARAQAIQQDFARYDSARLSAGFIEELAART